MELTPRQILASIGYEVDGRGNIRQTSTQLALVSIEDAGDGGVLRIHGDNERFFCDTADGAELAFPSRITARHVYFQGKNGWLRIPRREFVDNMLLAFKEYNRIVTRRMAG